MKSINVFISENYEISKITLNEALKIGSKSKVKDNHPIEVIYNKNGKLCCTEDELTDISSYAEELPIKPNKVKVGVNGNIRLDYDYYMKNYKSRKFYINITKPDRYEGSFKITMEVGNWAAFEYPMGSKFQNKNGDLLLPDVESVFNKINEQWKKRNLSNLINTND
jgi:hypothetical protein